MKSVNEGNRNRGKQQSGKRSDSSGSSSSDSDSSDSSSSESRKSEPQNSKPPQPKPQVIINDPNQPGLLDIQKIQMTRKHLAEHIDSPMFKDLIVNTLIRFSIQNEKYVNGFIKDVEES